MTTDLLDELDVIGAPLFALSLGGSIKGKYAAPEGWPTARADDNDVDALRVAPGAAMGCGVAFDVIDVDPRNGGIESLAELAGDDLVPPVRWVVQTPSGGWHLYITPLGITVDCKLPGIDLQDAGRLVVVPPTTGYRVLPRSEWPDLGAQPADAGERLSVRLGAGFAGAERGAVHPDGPEWRGAGLHPYAEAAVRAELARLDECDAVGWGGPPWDATTYAVACNLMELANSNWSGYTLDQAEADLLDRAPSDPDFGRPEHEAKWRSAASGVGQGNRVYPGGEPGDDFGQVREPAPSGDRFRDGASFILDAPDHVPAVWGSGDAVLWAEGEALTVCGPPGVGKTTVTGQVVRARLGLADKVLGYPVRPTVGRVLYLAMDRPKQISRAMRRTFRAEDRDVLRQRLVVWAGPPLTDLAKHPEELLRMVRAADADTVFLDSLKDAAVGLSEDEVGAGYNRARQMCLAEGIEVIELHHMVKRNATGGAPTSLEDLYGSAWIAAGAGSVVLLWGKAGDPLVDFRHLKQPAAEVGPFRVVHDHTAGASEVWDDTDLVQLATAAGRDGLTVKAAAAVLFSTAKPTDAEKMKARRKLDALVRSGQLDMTEGDPRTNSPALWTPTDPLRRGA